MNYQPSLILLFFALLFISGCDTEPNNTPLQINGFHLSSSDPSALATWYTQNLGFSSSEDNGSLLLSNEFGQVDISPGTFPANPAQNQRTSGFFKIGFKTADLDGLYQKLRENGSSFRGDIFYDSHLKTRSLVSLDRDGNRVQFFEDPQVTGLTPSFFSIMALDLEQTQAWCESEFGFVEAHNLDLPERGLAIRLMQKDGILLELISDERLVSARTEIPGIQSILFNRSQSGNSAGKLVYNASADSPTPG